MTTISTLVTGWLIGAAAATTAPLPSYDVLGDRVATERAAPLPGLRPPQERTRRGTRRGNARKRGAAEEAAREQREAEREKWKAQVQAQQDRVHAQRERQQREWVETEGERVIKTFSVGKTGSVMLHNMSGDVVVMAGGGSEIRVEAIKRAKGRSRPKRASSSRTSSSPSRSRADASTSAPSRAAAKRAPGSTST